MHRFGSRALLLVTLSAVAGCASASLLPDEERIQLTREYEGKTAFLRASLHVLPFFSDTTRRLVSALPPDSIELLLDGSGAAILPGAPEGMLELGTRVRVERVEFPTSLVVTRRPLYSPRTQPWVYLSVVGGRPGRPFVAVLRQGIKTREEFLAAVDQLFSAEDPAAGLERYPPEIRAAVRAKRLAAGMDQAAVTLAWGRPEKIRQEWVAGARTETWIWPLGKRSSVFKDGTLTSFEPAGR